MGCSLAQWIVLMRIHQYIKNLFIFAPLFFAFDFSPALVWKTILIFVCFSLIASAVYIINDIQDVEQDRLHPKKKNRPIASGKIQKSPAMLFSFFLLIFGGGGILLVETSLLLPILLYLALNLLYTLALKQHALFDVLIIAIGFILRLFIGSIATKIELSHWIVITTFFLSLFLAFAKRRDDCLLFEKTGEKMRESIGGYNLIFIDICLGITAVMSILSYVMWSISHEAILHFSNYLYLTGIFVVMGILRYLQLVFVFLQGGSPTELILHDKKIHCIIFGWILSFVVLYFWRF